MSLGLVLGALVSLIFAVTMVKLSVPQNVNPTAPNFSLNAGQPASGKSE